MSLGRNQFAFIFKENAGSSAKTYVINDTSNHRLEAKVSSFLIKIKIFLCSFS